MIDPSTSAHLAIAGASVGLDVPATLIAAVRRAFEHLGVSDAQIAPTVWYRAGAHPDGSAIVNRHDRLRDRPIEAIGSTADALIDDLHLTIALHSREHVYIHAGVVTWKGGAILLPGRSRTGKSTLVEALVRHGAGYCSDEYARVGDDGSITPYARPIQLRSPAGRRSVDAATIGTVTETPVPASLVVFTSYADRAAFLPVEVAPAAAALELFDNTVVAETEPERAMRIVAQIARSARAVRSPRPDVATAAARILEFADRLEVTS